VNIERYRSIIPDWDRFVETIERPEPTTLRVCTRRVDPAEVTARLEADGFGLEPVDGLEDVFRVVERPRLASDTVLHWHGLYYIQQASTAVVAPVLDPAPGARVLDLCAAPGGKTTHLADRMGGRGCLVAVEVNENRVRALLGNLYRTAHTNVLVVSGDGRSLPDAALFDHVLTDVPCSAEGTLRKRGGKTRGRAPTGKFHRRLTRRQERLLRRALRLTRPGGTVLYVTCTFAPEENEAVVSRVLADAPTEVVPLTLPVPHASGLTAFEEERFHPALEGAARIYPHHLDSGGLFLCLLRRLEGEVPDTDASQDAMAAPVGGMEGGWAAPPVLYPPGDGEAEAARAIERALDDLRTTFGVQDEALERFRWTARGDSVWAHSAGEWPLAGWPEGGHWRLVSAGVRAFGPDAQRRLRPSNDLLRVLDAAVRERRVELTEGEALALLEGRGPAVAIGDGPVALVLEGHVIGRGDVRDGRLRSEIAKARARPLREVLERAVQRGD